MMLFCLASPFLLTFAFRSGSQHPARGNNPQGKTTGVVLQKPALQAVHSSDSFMNRNMITNNTTLIHKQFNFYIP
jgi:hypothetical protein